MALGPDAGQGVSGGGSQITEPKTSLVISVPVKTPGFGQGRGVAGRGLDPTAQTSPPPPWPIGPAPIGRGLLSMPPQGPWGHSGFGAELKAPSLPPPTLSWRTLCGWEGGPPCLGQEVILCALEHPPPFGSWRTLVHPLQPSLNALSSPNPSWGFGRSLTLPVSWFFPEGVAGEFVGRINEVIRLDGEDGATSGWGTGRKGSHFAERKLQEGNSRKETPGGQASCHDHPAGRHREGFELDLMEVGVG